jgi:hypothetical protein
MKRGPKPLAERVRMIDAMQMRYDTPARKLPVRLLEQLAGCKDDDARRILLGMSEGACK